jgi:hypothetical protein
LETDELVGQGERFARDLLDRRQIELRRTPMGEYLLGSAEYRLHRTFARPLPRHLAREDRGQQAEDQQHGERDQGGRPNDREGDVARRCVHGPEGARRGSRQPWLGRSASTGIKYGYRHRNDRRTRSGDATLFGVKVKRPERPIDAADWQRQMNLRLRAEFIAGAEEDWRQRTGRPMTVEELKRVLRRYPGDI